jgi:hypothetical protein
MQMAKKNDPLDGFRARTEEDEENEVLVRGIRGLSERGIDPHTIADVVASQDLVEALKADTILAKLVMFCAEILKEHMHAWSESNEPEKMNQQHLESRAARLVIRWVEIIQETGDISQQLIEQQEERND